MCLEFRYIKREKKRKSEDEILKEYITILSVVED